MKKIISILALAMAVCMPATAQKPNPSGKYNFITLQGGMQNTYDTQYAFGRTWTPTAAISFGRSFNYNLAARLNLNGIWAKGNAPFQNTRAQQFDFRYVTTDADLMVNMASLWRKGYSPVNLYLIGGLGWNHSWDNEEALALQNAGAITTHAQKDHQNAMNLRMGAMLEVNLCKNVALNLEADYNYLAYGKTQKFINHHNRFTAMAGLNFKFGYKKTKAAPAEEWATRIDTIWYDEPTEKTRIENGQAKWEVFYEIRESDMEGADAKIRAIGRFLKDYRDCKITVKSYADRGTGNPRINMEYSKQRSEKAVKALVEAGVSESLITAEYFGDTVQPYADNDKNRVTIIVATGLKDITDKSSVKKFRTEEVRYRVK